jgi:hypothetical protein
MPYNWPWPLPFTSFVITALINADISYTGKKIAKSSGTQKTAD